LFTVLAQEATDIPRPHRALVDVNLSEKRILLVDDNPTNRKLLTLQTRSWCMQPVAAESGKEALAILASQEKFDLAVLDMQMPEMDGIELAERIRALPGFADLPMVMLTSLGYRDPRATQELFAAFLNKPIKTSQLFNVLVSVLAPIETKKLKTQDLKLSIDPEMGVRLPLHILIAEDNPVNQKVATRMMEKLGYRPDLVANGLEVLEALKRQFYDVVFLDVYMPEMDGLQAAGEILKMFEGKLRPRLIAMTAAAMQGDRELCLEAGMDDYISKPVRAEELVKSINQCRPRPIPVVETVSAPVPPTQPELDEDICATLNVSLGFEADNEILLDLINLFLQETPSLMDTIRRGLAEGDIPSLTRAAHTLKSNGATFGANKLRDLSLQIEQKGRGENLEGVADMVRQLQEEYSRFRGVVDRAKGKLQLQ
jgi:CheY-like chemotaxis protein